MVSFFRTRHSTKELCSDNRHRILHNLWGIRRVILPIFGHTIKNSDGKKVNVKDICEQDHILPDYHNRFIPTLADFTNATTDLTSDEKNNINRIYHLYKDYPQAQEILRSPLSVTGQLQALRVTHNAWFCNDILPKTVNIPTFLIDFGAIQLFETMQFQLWMDNGAALPPSMVKFKKSR